ncbi:hypothetical protein BKA61DRAFT_670200 [Leptodontidium sp. MPI-SDFR-AT-0119]|nr:hypothetical protein BKA61DRAFT_670200 [Leptodontidium sp. MPI-SDFR-AT-0119]
MSACVSIDMGANAVANGVIKDMDDPISPCGSSNTASSPKSEDGCSRTSSLSTWPEPTAILAGAERLIFMLTASAARNREARNREAQVLAASRLPRSGLNPLAPAFAMRTSPVNPEVQAMKQQINIGYERYAQERKKCQENGDIQALIDLVAAGPASRADDGLQRSIDNIVATAAVKKKKEREHMMLLVQGLRENAITKPETGHTVSANVPAIIVAR